MLVVGLLPLLLRGFASKSVSERALGAGHLNEEWNGRDPVLGLISKHHCLM